MPKAFRLKATDKFNPDVEEWLSGEPAVLYSITRHWFSIIRHCGDDVRELLHDGCPVACVQDVAFAYVNVFASHVNVGVFAGSVLKDPAKLLQGVGKNMRHVKVLPDHGLDNEVLEALIHQAYMHARKQCDAG